MNWIKKNIYYILGILTVLFFLFGQGVMWYAIGGDSETYYIYFRHRMEVAPLYPLFFHILDLIFGRAGYLYAAAVVQMLVALVSIILFVRFIGTRMKLDIGSIVVVWICSLFPFYLLLPEDPIPHVLMTESFTYPLMYIYITMILKAVFDHKEKYFFYSVLFVEIMALIRGQMMFLFAVSIVIYFFWYIKQYFQEKKEKHGFFKKIFGRMVLLLASALLSVLVGKGLTSAYEKVFFDAHAQSFANHVAIQKALYCSDEEDAALFDDKIEREIFEKTYAEMKKEGTTYRFTNEGLNSWKNAISRAATNSWLVQDAIRDVLKSNDMWSENELEQEDLILYYEGKMSKPLFKDNWKQYINLFFVCLPAGFVSTVLFHKESIYLLIHIATIFLYLAAVGVSIFVSKKSRRLLPESEYMMLIVITASGNVFASNLVHFGLQRYLAYTVGMFYVGAYLLVRRCFLLWKERKVVRKQ